MNKAHSSSIPLQNMPVLHPGASSSSYHDTNDEHTGLLADPDLDEDLVVYRRDSQPPPPPPTKSKNKKKDKSRTIHFQRRSTAYPPNTVRNQKYNVFTFLPVVLYEQFKFFFNLYFLLVALSQFVPALKIGFILTYIGPLAFVLLVTMGKEAYDDYKRNLRDKEANSARYLMVDSPAYSSKSRRTTQYTSLPSDETDSLHSFMTRTVPSSSLQVGDLVILHKDQRVPADLVLLRTTDESGTCFIRTDQLDGETDWKVRVFRA